MDSGRSSPNARPSYRCECNDGKIVRQTSSTPCSGISIIPPIPNQKVLSSWYLFCYGNTAEKNQKIFSSYT